MVDYKIPTGDYELSMLMMNCIFLGTILMGCISLNLYYLFGGDFLVIRAIIYNVLLFAGMHLVSKKIQGWATIVKDYVHKGMEK